MVTTTSRIGRYHQTVTSMPPAPATPPQGPYPPPWPPIVPQQARKWPSLAAFLLSLAAISVAIAAWFRPLPDNTPPSPRDPTYSADQTAQAKTNVCDAYRKEQKALDLAGARNGGDDPTAILAVATSTRQVLDVGGRYLLAKLAEEPATPPELAQTVRKLADLDLDLTVGYLDGLTNQDADQQPLLKAADEVALNIQRICK
jgi:hypothetical protein